MNIGEVLVKFGAETSGFMGGLRLVESAIGGMGGFVKGALGDMNSGLHSITSGFATMGTGAGGAFSSMRIGAQDVASGMLKLGAVIALVGGIAAVAIGVTIGVVAVRAAADFQQGMARLVTGAGDVTDNMQKMGQSILGISTATGVLTGELLPAMYQIISAGQRGAVAENTLKVAAMGSVAEQAKIVDVAKALTTAMTDYGTSQFNATQFMNGYTRATQLGKLTLEQLSTSMGPILPLAKNLGISFADVAGAMSTMTNAGIPAERSATSLRFLFQSLEVPTTKAKNAMESMGLSSVAVGNELKKSLPGALEMIYKAALRAGPEGSVPFNRAVSDMIGGQRSLQAYLALTGTHFATYSANARAIADAMNFSKTAVLGWDTAQQNFNTKLAQAQAALQAVFITIGSHLLPVLTQIVGQIVPIIQKFADWVTHTNAIENAIKAVAPIFAAFFAALMSVLPTVIGLFLKFMAVLGQLIAAVAGNKQGMEALILVAKVLGVLVVAVLAAGLLTLAIVFGMIALVIVAVITVVRALILAWNGLVAAANWVAGAWNSAIAFLVGLWHTLVAAATTAFNAVKNAIVSAFNATIAWIGGAWNSAIAFIVGIWNTLRGAATTAFNAIRTAIMAAVNAVITWLVQAWNTCVQAVAAAFAWLYNHNYYFKQLVDTIRNTVQAVITWLQGAWQTCVSFISSVWSTLSGLASAAWSAMTSVIMSVVNAVVSWLQGAWQSAIAWLGGAWNTLAGLASSVWNAISSTISSAVTTATNFLRSAWTSAAAFLNGVWNTIKAAVVSAWNFIVAQFAAAWGRVSGPLNSLGAGIGNFFSGLANQAIAWGANIIQGIINGINSMIGGVIGAASNVASTITSILGFHSPPAQGPAKDADKWMPNMVALLTKGMTSGVPSVSRAATQLAQPIQGSLSASGPGQTRSSESASSRPIIIQFGNAEYRGFVQNLGRDLQGTIIIQKGGLR